MTQNSSPLFGPGAVHYRMDTDYASVRREFPLAWMIVNCGDNDFHVITTIPAHETYLKYQRV